MTKSIDAYIDACSKSDEEAMAKVSLMIKYNFIDEGKVLNVEKPESEEGSLGEIAKASNWIRSNVTFAKGDAYLFRPIYSNYSKKNSLIRKGAYLNSDLKKIAELTDKLKKTIATDKLKNLHEKIKSLENANKGLHHSKVKEKLKNIDLIYNHSKKYYSYLESDDVLRYKLIGSTFSLLDVYEKGGVTNSMFWKWNLNNPVMMHMLSGKQKILTLKVIIVLIK